MRSFRCRHVIRSGPPGEAVNPCTSPAGTTTTEPPEASIVSSPARNEPDPSCRTKTSAYGWVCGPGPWPGGLAWTKKETGTPPWSRPRNVRDTSFPGRSALRMCRPTPLLLAPCSLDPTRSPCQGPASRSRPTRCAPAAAVLTRVGVLAGGSAHLADGVADRVVDVLGLDAQLLVDVPGGVQPA